jgi:hypothetical protein
MAGLWGVSLPTMAKAVRLLADRGIVCCTQGRKISRAGSGVSGAMPPSRRRFYGAIRERIVSGTYRAGRALPKVNYFVLTDRVSPNTVSAVCAQLAREDLIYKAGKQWVVGAAPPKESARSIGIGHNSPTVLLLFNFGMDWEPFFSNLWMAPFSGTFVTELQHYGWATRMGFLVNAGARADTEGPPTPVGNSQILAFAKSLEEEYRGAVLYFGTGPYDSAPECVRLLLGLGRPVIVWDHNDRLESFCRETVRKPPPPCFRFHFDERTGIRVALQALAAQGHRTVGLPFYVSPAASWIPGRVQMIQEIARTVTPPISVITSEQRETFWKYETGFNLAWYPRDLMSALTQGDGKPGKAVQRRPSLRSLLLANTPSLTTLLDRGVTAIVCLNDSIAREIYLWATYAGMRIPGDISLISFDNRVDCRNFPVTTIDFGFSRLGYQAAHLLIGDIPVKADKRGNIPGPCTIMDRGSLASPGQRLRGGSC